MNFVFSADDLDALWHSSIMAAPTPELPYPTPEMVEKSGDVGKMSRSASEWAFQRFIQEDSASSVASTKREEDDDDDDGDGHEDVVEIKNPPLASIPIDSDEYQAYLKSRLHLACAAAAMSRVFSISLSHTFR